MEAYYAKVDTMELAYNLIIILDQGESKPWEREMNEIHNVKESMKKQWLPMRLEYVNKTMTADILFLAT